MIKAKKSLGQNFLIDQNIINKILLVTDIKNKSVLEVGPGTGNLTSHIIKKSPKKFFVIEKDENLVLKLSNDFKNEIKIINDDVLNVNEKNIDDDELVVFGNLPYNISTEILCKWILNLDKNNFWFSCLILMFQKEVADRIISNFNTSRYGRLSILSNWKLNIEKICDVKPNSFSPKPRVDSSLLFFKPKTNFFKIENPKNLEIITRVFFSQRRKMLKKPFNQLFNGNVDIIKKLKIDLNLRPQNLDFETYYKLTKEYENLI
ncbi:ribosomal RNA small subunit methyltransferase A [Pelagibacterales bacterium SAG-MED37]|nr:ribosomal RNA small subunit methyltransferase A [Pelagibacterales bacterium SAG-MED37]